jgi:hypothetical protein
VAALGAWFRGEAGPALAALDEADALLQAR